MHYDALIIGCGMAGLGAGIRLAMYGRQVLIVERHNAPGGLNSFYFQEGRKYDVGLHAVTNYVPPGVKGTPLAKLYRQLRIDREAFGLCPQKGSRIAFADCDLRFSNDFALLESEVAQAFPHEIDGFRRLTHAVLEHQDTALDSPILDAKPIVAEFIHDPLLREMLFCPLMFYGSARANEMDWDQFVILFKALYREGFARPAEGVRRIIKVLLDRYREAGGERRMKCGVRQMRVRDDAVAEVILDSGEAITADLILSSAGKVETLRLCEDQPQEVAKEEVGAFSFVETITVLDQPARTFGWEETIVFFNDTARFDYSAPQDLADPRSGVLCFPDNYQYPAGQELPHGYLRITSLADHGRWISLPEETYRARKATWYDQLGESALRFVSRDEISTFAGLKPHTLAQDMFTPRTIEHYTGHLGGAVYGSPRKVRDGRTHLRNLHLIGTDQGFLGIIGALLSGVSMANLHGLAGGR